MLKKYIRNAGKQWKPSEVKQLRSLAQANTPTRLTPLQNAQK